MAKKDFANVVNHAGVTVKVYKCGTGSDRPFHKFTYFLHGKCKAAVRRGLSDAQAGEEARKLAETLAGKDRPVLELTAEDVHTYNRVRELIGPTGKPLEVAAAEYAGAITLLAPYNISLETAARSWLDRNANVVAKNFGDAVEEFLKEKELTRERKRRNLNKEEPRGQDRHMQFLRLLLAAWAKDFSGPLHEITAKQINAWLARKQADNGWINLTRNHYRAAISNLLHWAKRKEYLPATWNEMEKVEAAEVEHPEVHVFTPKDAEAIMRAADEHYPHYAAFLAIGLFAGVRSAEISRMNWGDIYWHQNIIFVGKGKVNSQQRRVPMQPNCRAWLEPYKKESGFICEIADPSHGMDRIAKTAGIKWVANGPRHSYISYRKAILKGNLHQIADEAGNSPKVIQRHYAKPVAEEDALAYFKIAPDGGDTANPGA